MFQRVPYNEAPLIVAKVRKLYACDFELEEENVENKDDVYGDCVSLSANVHLNGQQSSDTAKESSKCEKETEASLHTCALVD
uniref:Uncharacterized protein n=1 Tax=Vespula pensylvanica TaxID=30213 RepID=A0A834U9S6_VESPE|nr:hypothetical protein H0235_009142 [Vespula pensylvanica]